MSTTTHVVVLVHDVDARRSGRACTPVGVVGSGSVDARRRAPSATRVVDGALDLPVDLDRAAVDQRGGAARLHAGEHRRRPGRGARRRARQGPLDGRSRGDPAIGVLLGVLRTPTTTSRMPPITTHASATLNTGHHCGSMKSTTRPPRKPSPSRKSGRAGCRARRRAPGRPATAADASSARARYRATARSRATTPTHRDDRAEARRPRPNAMPLLNVRFSRSVQNRWMIRSCQVGDRPPLRELVDARPRPATLMRDRQSRRRPSPRRRDRASIVTVSWCPARRPSPRPAQRPTGWPRAAPSGSARRTRRQAVGAVVDAASAASISSTGCHRLRRQGEVALALDDDGVALARLLVELDVAGSSPRRARRPRPRAGRPGGCSVPAPRAAARAGLRGTSRRRATTFFGAGAGFGCGRGGQRPSSATGAAFFAGRSLLGRRRSLLGRRGLLRGRRPSWPGPPPSSRARPSWPWARPSSRAARLLGRQPPSSPWRGLLAPAAAFFVGGRLRRRGLRRRGLRCSRLRGACLRHRCPLVPGKGSGTVRPSRDAAQPPRPGRRSTPSPAVREQAVEQRWRRRSSSRPSMRKRFAATASPADEASPAAAFTPNSRRAARRAPRWPGRPAAARRPGPSARRRGGRRPRNGPRPAARAPQRRSRRRRLSSYQGGGHEAPYCTHRRAAPARMAGASNCSGSGGQPATMSPCRSARSTRTSTSSRSRSASLARWRERDVFAEIARLPQGRRAVGLLRGPADRQRPPGHPPRVGPRVQGPLPPLPDHARPARAPQGRLGLPRPPGRGRGREGARASRQARDRGVRHRRVQPALPRVGAALRRGLVGAHRAHRHVARHRRRLLDADRTTTSRASGGCSARCGTRASSTRATRSSPTAPAAAPRSSSHELGARATTTSPTRRCTCASRSPTAPADVDLLVWTTTPWTLVSNVGAAVGPDIDLRARARRRRRTRPRARRGRGRARCSATTPRSSPGSPAATSSGWHYERPFDRPAARRRPASASWSPPTSSPPTTARASCTSRPRSARSTARSGAPRASRCSTRSTPTARFDHDACPDCTGSS